jgi:RimJ/RimL family protein N-acetyltransferase
MTRCIWGQRGDGSFAVIQRFISTRIFGKHKEMPGDTVMAVVSGDAFLGAVIYQNYDSENGTIEISAASAKTNWLSRASLLEMFSYPFLQLGCQAVVMRCDPANDRLNRIFSAYGFARYDIPRLRGRDKAEAIYVLGDDDWRGNGFHKELTHG